MSVIVGGRHEKCKIEIYCKMDCSICYEKIVEERLRRHECLKIFDRLYIKDGKVYPYQPDSDVCTLSEESGKLIEQIKCPVSPLRFRNVSGKFQD